MKQDAEKRRLEWRAAQIELRKSFANTPAGFKSKDVELAEENALLSDWEEYREKQQNRLCGEYRKNQGIFVGRKRELQRITEQIHLGKGTPVIVYGLGGSGKTALVHEWMKRNQDRYVHVLEMQFKYSLCDTVCDDENLNITDLTYRKEFHGNKTRYFHLKLDQLADHVRKYKTLILIDACDFGKDRNMKYVFSLPCDLIVTTRVNPVLWGYEDGILVESLQPDAWEDFYHVYLKEKYETWRSVVQEQWEYSKGHVAWMRFTLMGIKEIEKKYEKDGRIRKLQIPQNLQLEFQEFEKGLFRHLNFKLKEKFVLQCLSLMPDHQMPETLLQAFTGCEEESILKLKKFLFLKTKGTDREGESRIELHPVIADAVKAILPVTCNSCSKMIRNTAIWLRERMENYPIEENHQIELFVLAFVEGFPRKANYLAEEFLQIYGFLEVQGYQMERISLVNTQSNNKST